MRKAEASSSTGQDRSKPPILMATMGLLRRPLRLRELVGVPQRREVHGEVAGVAGVLSGGTGSGRAACGCARVLPLDHRRAERRASRRGVGTHAPGKTPTMRRRLLPVRIRRPSAERSAPCRRALCASWQGVSFRKPAVGIFDPVARQQRGRDRSTPELVGVPALGKPSQSFDRWVVGADLRANVRWWLARPKCTASSFSRRT